MKKKTTVLLFLCVLIAATGALTLRAFAQEERQMPHSYSEMLEGLPEEITPFLPDGIYSSDAEEAGKAVSDMSGADYIFSVIGELTGAKLGDALALLAALIGVIILSAIFGAVRNSLKSDALSKAVGFCSSCAIFSAVIAVQYRQLSEVSVFFDRIKSLMLGMIPVTGAIYAMGGNVSTAAASSGTLYVFLTFCETLCAGTVLPVASLCTAFAMCGVLSPSISLKGLTDTVKKTYTFVLGFVMTVLLAVLASQTTLSTASDSVASRAAKLVASSVIPVVGGSVGDTLKTVGSSVGFIKSTAGISGIIFIFLLLLPTLISLLLTRLVFMLAGAVAELLGCTTESKLLGELSGIYGMVIAVVSMVSVMFILAMAIFVKTTLAVG